MDYETPTDPEDLLPVPLLPGLILATILFVVALAGSLYAVSDASYRDGYAMCERVVRGAP